MSKDILTAVSVLLASISTFVYIVAILKGEAKPHRTTRLVFLVITTLTTVALFAQGNQVAVWLAGVSMFQSILIFLLSLKYGMGGRSKTDVICLLLALLGVVFWQVTKNPVIALYFAIGADFAGIIPTLIKTYRQPDTEVWTFYFLDVCAGVFNLLASEKFVFNQFLYPFYIILINLSIVFLVKRPDITRRLRGK